MPDKTQANTEGAGLGRVRRRLRGALNSRTGTAVGITSLVAPLLGLVINNLRQPNSLSRRLLGMAVNKLTAPKYKKAVAIDITDQVEILNENHKPAIEQ